MTLLHLIGYVSHIQNKNKIWSSENLLFESRVILVKSDIWPVIDYSENLNKPFKCQPFVVSLTWKLKLTKYLPEEKWCISLIS